MARKTLRASIHKTFAAADLVPLTGSSNGSTTVSARQVAERIASFDAIYLQHPAHRRLFAQFDYLRELGQAGTGPKRGLRVIGPSGAGKTTAIEQYRAIDAARRPLLEGVVPVVQVALDRACTTKRFVASCLDFYGDEYSEASVESTLRKRLYECIRRFRTELVIVDEVQHLNFRTSERSDPTDAFKRILDDGLVSLVFVGDETALPLMKRNIQLANRMIAPGDILPLNRFSTEDSAIFARFVRRLDQEMVGKDVTEVLSELDDPRTLLCMHVVSTGLLGRVVNLVRAALQIATVRGARRIEPYDLAKAVDDWAIPQDIVGYNPFVMGVPGA